MTNRLESLISALKGHKVFIQTHDFPDPDALASAFGLQKLLMLFDVKTVICYSGIISKASTTSMVSTFGIEMTDIESVSNMNKDDYVITIDAQTNNANIVAPKGTIVACIDHHPTTTPYEYLFKDVRICGACSSIVADYYFSNGLQPDKNTATALLYGLKMDTEDFRRGVTSFDIDMYRMLFDFAEESQIKDLLHQQMEFSDLRNYTIALGNIKVFDGIAFSYIDLDVTDGLIASVSDFMLTLLEVEFTVVYAKRSNGYKFSVRSQLDYLDAGVITTNALEGIGTGGGHGAMAGGYVPFANIEDAEFDVEEEIQNRFINSVYFSRTLQDVLTDPLSNFTN